MVTSWGGAIMKMKTLEPREAEWLTQAHRNRRWKHHAHTGRCISPLALVSELHPFPPRRLEGREGGRHTPGREDPKRTGRSRVFFAAWGDVNKVRGMAFRRILAFSILILWLIFKPESLRLIIFTYIFLKVCWVMKTIAFGNRISQTGLYEMTNLL